EADIKTMRQVAENVCEHRVPVIFLETITNPKVTMALQEACQSRDWEVQIASHSLYSDDLGESAPYDTFLGAFKSNVELISASLR
ncbi:MAG: zinc ABC transporter solute-binding protein, partial [Planctomycetaceae bacterium]|nr:zinc ABC transporter solute-binding protein [Planctomycetaceae bacterium]